MSMSDRSRSLEELPLKSLETALFEAVQNDDAEQVNTLLEQKANPYSKNADGFSALYLATQDNKMSVVQALLKAKADPNIHAEPASSLFGAVKAFFSSQEEAKNTPKVRTPLAIAVDKQHIKIAKLLIQYKANPNVRNTSGRRLICQATLNQHADMVALLLEAKANVHATALLKGLSPTDESPLFTQLSLLHMVALTYTSPFKEQSQKIVNMLLKAGAKIDVTDMSHYNYTPIHYAASYKHEDMVSLLLEAKAKSDFINNEGDVHLLNKPIQNGDVSMVRLLLDKGVSPGGYKGLYPYMGYDRSKTCPPIALAIITKAPKETRMELVKLLLPKEEKKLDRLTLMCDALDNKETDLDLVKYLLPKPADDAFLLGALLKSVKTASPQAVKLLLDAKASVLISEKDRYASMQAHCKERLASMPMLAPYRDLYTGMPVHWAVSMMQDNPDKLALLLEAKAMVNEQDLDSACTPLHIALHNNLTNHVALLLKARANVNMKEAYGQTALHLAMIYPNPEHVVGMLLKAKADPWVIRNNQDVWERLQPVLQYENSRRVRASFLVGTLSSRSVLARAQRRPLFEPLLLKLVLISAGQLPPVTRKPAPRRSMRPSSSSLS